MLIIKDLSKRTLYNVLSKLVFSISFFVVNIIAANLLDPSEFGKSQYLVWFVYTSWLVLSFGLPTALTRFIPIASLQKLISITKSPVLIALVIFLFCSFSLFTYFLFAEEMIVVWILFIGIAWSLVVNAFLEGYFLNRIHFVGSCSAAIIILFICVPLLKYVEIEGYYLLVATYFIVYSIYGTWNLFEVLKSVASSALPEVTVKDFLQYSLLLWVITLFSTLLWQRSEIVFIELYLSSVDIGYFSIGFMMANIMVQFSGIFVSALLPYFSLNHSQLYSSFSKTIFRVNLKLIGWFSLFTMSLFIVNAQWIIQYLFGKEYLDGYIACLLLMISMPIASIGTVGSTVLKAIGRTKILLISNMVGLVIAFPLYYWVTRYYHLEGLLMARIFVLLLVVSIEAVYTYKQLNFATPLFHLVSFFGLSYALISAVFGFIGHTSLLEFIILTVYTFAIYGVFSHLLHLLDFKDIRLLLFTGQN